MDLVRLINRINLQAIGKVNFIKLIREESLKAQPRGHFGLLQAKYVADAIHEAYRLGVIRGQTINKENANG